MKKLLLISLLFFTACSKNAIEENQIQLEGILAPYDEADNRIFAPYTIFLGSYEDNEQRIFAPHVIFHGGCVTTIYLWNSYSILLHTPVTTWYYTVVTTCGQFTVTHSWTHTARMTDEEIIKKLNETP